MVDGDAIQKRFLQTMRRTAKSFEKKCKPHTPFDSVCINRRFLADRMVLGGYTVWRVALRYLW